jgi:hypothetical protein
MASPTRVATMCPPIKARGCASSASGDPMTSTMEVTNGMMTSGWCDVRDIHSMVPMAIAAPRPATAPARVLRDHCGGSHRSPSAANPTSLGLTTKEKGRQIALPPPSSRRMTYFRLVTAVRSAESLTMPAVPHQFEPVPSGLIGVTLVVPEALKAPVKALQLPFDKLVSE